MKAGYTIDQFGSSKMEMICVYNWKNTNEVGMACYNKYYLDIPTENLVAIFKVKPRS